MHRMASTNVKSLETDRLMKLSNESVKFTDKQRNKTFSEEHGRKDDNVSQNKMLDLKSKVLKKASSKVIRRDTWAGPADSRNRNDLKTKYVEELHNTSGHKVKKKESLSGNILLDKKIPKDKNKIPKKSDKLVELCERNKTRSDERPVRRSRLDLYESSRISNNLPQESHEIKREPSENNTEKEATINSLVLENNVRKRDHYTKNNIEAACETHLNSIYNNVPYSENKYASGTKSENEAFDCDLKVSESLRNIEYDSNVKALEESSNKIVIPKVGISQTEDSHSTEIYIDTQKGQIRVKPGDQHSLSSISDLNSTKVLIQQRDTNKSADGQKFPCSVVDDNQSAQDEIRDIFGLTELNTNLKTLDNGELETHGTSVSPFALVKDCNSEVEFWLHGLSLPDVEKYVKIFAHHEIDLLDLEFMTASQLHDMGITALGALDKILKGVKDLRSDGKTKHAHNDQKSRSSKQLPLSSITWEEDGQIRKSKSKPSSRKSVESDFKPKKSKKPVPRNALEYKSQESETAIKSREEERSSSAMSVHSDGGESILSSRSNVSNKTPSFSASTKSSDAKCVAKRPPTSKSNTQSKDKIQKVNMKTSEKKNDSYMSEKAGFRLSQMEGKPTKSVLIRQRSSSLSRDNPRQARKEKEDKEDKRHGQNQGYEDKGHNRNLRYRSRSADAVKRKAIEGVQTAAKRFEERLQRDRDKQMFNLADERLKAKRDEMAARHLQREKHKELMVEQSSDTEEDTSQPAVRSPHVEDESLESLVTVNILSQSGPARQPTKGNSCNQADNETTCTERKVNVRKSLRRVEPARRAVSKLHIKPDGLQINKASPLKAKNGHRDMDKSPRSQSEPESGYKTDGSTSYSQIEDRVTEIQGKIKRLKARAGSGDDLTGNLLQDLQAQLQQFQHIMGTRNQVSREEEKNQGTSGNSHEDRCLPDSPGKQSYRDLRRSASFELPKASPIEEILAEDESMNKDIKDDNKIVRMSKRELLDEMRKEKKNHHLQIRQLQKELERIKHADPVTSMEIRQAEIIYKNEDLIGEGTFSRVFKGLYQGSEVAVKKLKVPLKSQDKNYFTAELSLLKELRHPRVVLLIGVCTTDKHPVMVLEYMSRGSLYHYLHDSNNESLDHALYFQVARDVTAGMKYLHSHRPEVIHLDLKSMNVLLCQSYRAKIADFGFSKLRHDAGVKSKTRTKQTSVSSPAWMSPELLNKGEVTTKTDVYSFGVILWEMLTRQEPYNNLSVFQILERVRKNKRPEIPVSAPDGLQLLISQCWDQNPAKRPQFKDILLLLENLEFPPAWRELFRKAGVPDEALSNVHSTRNIIKLVSEMLDLHTLPNFMLKPKSRTSIQGKKSDKDIPAELNENDHKKGYVKGEGDRDDWDIETVTTLSGDDLSDESDVTLQELRDSSADESIVSSESNDDNSVTSSDLASTVVSVDSQRIKKRPVNVFIPSLQLSIESARKEFSAERDRISRSSWMSISLDDRSGSSQENYSEGYDKNTVKNKLSGTNINLLSDRSGSNSFHSFSLGDENLSGSRNLKSSRTALSSRSATDDPSDVIQDSKMKNITNNCENNYGPSSDRSARPLTHSLASQQKFWNDTAVGRSSLTSNENLKDLDKSNRDFRVPILTQLSNRSAGSSASEDRVPILSELSKRSAKSFTSEDRVPIISELSNRSARSSSPSSIVLTESYNLHSSARRRRRSRNDKSLSEKSDEYLMRESFNNMRPPSPKKRVSITKKLLDTSVNSENDSARSEPLVSNDNSSSVQCLPTSVNVDSSYDSFFGFQSPRNLGQRLQSHENMKSSQDLNAKSRTNVNSFKASLDFSSQNLSFDNKMDKDLTSVKRSQVYIVDDQSEVSISEVTQSREEVVDRMEKYVDKTRGSLSKLVDVPVGVVKKMPYECVEEGRHKGSNADNDIQLIKSSHSLDTGMMSGGSKNDYSRDKSELLKSGSEKLVKSESQVISDFTVEQEQISSNPNIPKASSKGEKERIEGNLSVHLDEKNGQTNTGMQEIKQLSLSEYSPSVQKHDTFKQNNINLQEERQTRSKVFKTTEIKHDGGEKIRVIPEEKKKPAITPRKSKMKSSQDNLILRDSGNLMSKSQTLDSATGLSLDKEGKQSESKSSLKQANETYKEETQNHADVSKYDSLSIQVPVKKDNQVNNAAMSVDNEQKSQKSSKIRVKLRKDPLAVQVTRDCPSPVPPAPPPPPPPVFNLSKSMSTVSKSVQHDAPRLSIADELKHKISQRQSISEGIKVMRKDSGHAFKPVKTGNVIGTSKNSQSNDMKNSTSQIENGSSNMIRVNEGDDLLVPQQSEGLPSFVVQSVELQDQKEHLRSISKPHPDQVDDLSGASQEQLSSIAEILRKAVMGRRVAMREDGDSVSQSFDSVATGWSMDLT